MKREEWQAAYQPSPALLEARVASTLARLPKQPSARRVSLRTAAIVLALLLALGGVAYAVWGSKTAELFGWFYGGSWQQDIAAGDIATPMLTRQLGDVTYTIEEMVYKKQGKYPGLYGVVRIAPAPGSDIVLLPEDTSVDDPAGYLLHYGGTGEDIPDEYTTYAQEAAQRGAKIVMARAAINSVTTKGQSSPEVFGEAWLPQPDNTLLGTWEIPFEDSGLTRADAYTLSVWLANWEISPQGEYLWEGPDSTRLSEDWEVTITPHMEEE